MMKTSEEYEQEIEDLKEQIKEIEKESEELLQRLDDSFEDYSSLENEYSEVLSKFEDRELVSEKAFNAGYDACCCGHEQFKAWLEYRIEARL